MKEPDKSTYRLWLIIFAIVFVLGLQEIFGLRALIAIMVRHPDVAKTELSTAIQTGIVTLLDAVMAVAAIALSIRTTLKRSIYQAWLVAIAGGFTVKFVLGLIAGNTILEFIRRYDFAHHKAEYYVFIVQGIIILFYGVLALVAFLMSRRLSQNSSDLNQTSRVI